MMPFMHNSDMYNFTFQYAPSNLGSRNHNGSWAFIVRVAGVLEDCSWSCLLCVGIIYLAGHTKSYSLQLFTSWVTDPAVDSNSWAVLCLNVSQQHCVMHQYITAIKITKPEFWNSNVVYLHRTCQNLELFTLPSV